MNYALRLITQHKYLKVIFILFTALQSYENIRKETDDKFKTVELLKVFLENLDFS